MPEQQRLFSPKSRTLSCGAHTKLGNMPKTSDFSRKLYVCMHVCILCIVLYVCMSCMYVYRVALSV